MADGMESWDNSTTLGDLLGAAGKLKNDLTELFAIKDEVVAARSGLGTLTDALDAFEEYAEFVQNGLLALADFRGAWSTLTGPLDAQVAVSHNDAYWSSKNAIAAVELSEPGVSSDWIWMGGSLGAPLNTNGNQIQESRGTDIASAATISIPTDGNYFAVTGTTGISAINTTGRVGTEFTLAFSGIVTLIHSASLILPGDTDYTTAAGSVLKFTEEASGVFRCTGTASGGGGAWVVVEKISVTSTVSTVDFDGLDDSYECYKVIFTGVVLSGATKLLMRVESGASWQATGYYSFSVVGVSGSSTASGNAQENESFLEANNQTGIYYSGEITLPDITNTEVYQQMYGNAAASNAAGGAAYHSAFSGHWNSKNAVTGIQVYFSGETIESGTFVLIGLKGA